MPYDKFKTKLLESIDKSAPLTDKDTQAAFKLLTTGQAESDIKDTVLGMLNQIPRFPAQILADIPNIFRDPTDFPRLPGFDVAAKSINSIIRPDKAHPDKNRIFRLAILAYARMNGINLEETNLLDLSDFFSNRLRVGFYETGRAWS
ncbi:hypothetical protein [Methylocucumis oryzae]|uniref:Uncharacterized protein n=1 Tax=Methylocucumis oryzae TaxID=1632867 RepID=A0A0F3IES1_9GAMM|nr:hypothetical protein [Methylocucumis oryzae]KJV05167.1 hypothetical protein VZ94_20210 [Methylocucumis oryzae]